MSCLDAKAASRKEKPGFCIPTVLEKISENNYTYDQIIVSGDDHIA
jgi:hypothetical protein